jgi:hypothetical protein
MRLARVLLPVLALAAAACTSLLGDFDVSSAPDDASTDGAVDGAAADTAEDTAEDTAAGDATTNDAEDGGSDTAVDTTADTKKDAPPDVAIDTNPPPPCGDKDQMCCTGSTCPSAAGLRCDPTLQKCIPATASGDIGRACSSNAQCSANACTPVTNMGPGGPETCTQRCQSSADCPGNGPAGGWTCASSPALNNIQVCECIGPTQSEVCNGRDDDCNGIVDDPGVADSSCKSSVGPAAKCLNAVCMCGGMTCGSQCIDVSTDGQNCGTCGHSCLGGTCQGGHCQPYTVYDAASLGFAVNAIAVDASYVYFLVGNYTDGSLMRCSSAQGPCTGLTQLQPNLYNASGLALSGSVFAITTAGTNTATIQQGTRAYSCAWPSCTTLSVLDSQWGNGTAYYGRVATDGTLLYYFDGRPTGSLFMATAGVANSFVAVTSAPANTNIVDVKLNGGRVYWTEAPYQAGGTPAMKSCPTGGACSAAQITYEMSTGLLSPQAIAMDSSFMVMADSGVYNSSNGTIYTCGVPCNDAKGTAIGGQGYPTAVAFDAGAIYWINLSEGAIKSCPRTGACVGNTRTLASPIYTGAYLVQDSAGTSFYYANNSQLMRIAK